MTDEFYSDCIYLSSEATISRISEMCRLDSAYPVPVLHFPSWIVVTHLMHCPLCCCVKSLEAVNLSLSTHMIHWEPLAWIYFLSSLVPY